MTGNLSPYARPDVPSTPRGSPPAPAADSRSAGRRGAPCAAARHWRPRWTDRAGHRADPHRHPAGVQRLRDGPASSRAGRRVRPAAGVRRRRRRDADVRVDGRPAGRAADGRPAHLPDGHRQRCRRSTAVDRRPARDVDGRAQRPRAGTGRRPTADRPAEPGRCGAVHPRRVPCGRRRRRGRHGRCPRGPGARPGRPTARRRCRGRGPARLHRPCWWVVDPRAARCGPAPRRSGSG